MVRKLYSAYKDGMRAGLASASSSVNPFSNGGAILSYLWETGWYNGIYAGLRQWLKERGA